MSADVSRRRAEGVTNPQQGDRGDTERLRVVHCPVNIAGIPWTNVRALRRKGIDATLVVFNTQPFRRNDADWNLNRPQSLVRRQVAQWHALIRLLPRADVFHFYFGLTLVPQALQFPILRLLQKKSVFHFLGSDIRGKTPSQLVYARRADARVVGSFDALRWVPDAEMIPPGIELDVYRPVPPSGRERPLVVHAPSSRARKGTEHVVAACAELPVELDVVEGLPNEQARERYARADIVVEQLNAGWHGMLGIEAMALGKPVVTFLHDAAVRRTEEAFGVQVPIVNATKETLVQALRPLVESVELRRRIGAESRAYVERVHDADRVGDRLIELYAGL